MARRRGSDDSYHAPGRRRPGRGLVADCSRAISTLPSRRAQSLPFAHCIGIPDEYGYIVDSDYFVHYFRPDGTADAAVIQAGEPREVDDPLGTLLSGYGAFRYEAVPRHAWNVAREVQELLRDETGREIAC